MIFFPVPVTASFNVFGIMIDGHKVPCEHISRIKKTVRD